MRSFRSKPVGWRGESHRHYLAAKGIRSVSDNVQLQSYEKLKEKHKLGGEIDTNVEKLDSSIAAVRREMDQLLPKGSERGRRDTNSLTEEDKEKAKKFFTLESKLKDLKVRRQRLVDARQYYASKTSQLLDKAIDEEEKKLLKKGGGERELPTSAEMLNLDVESLKIGRPIMMLNKDPSKEKGTHWLDKDEMRKLVNWQQINRKRAKEYLKEHGTLDGFKTTHNFEASLEQKKYNAKKCDTALFGTTKDEDAQTFIKRNVTAETNGDGLQQFTEDVSLMARHPMQDLDGEWEEYTSLAENDAYGKYGKPEKLSSDRVERAQQRGAALFGKVATQANIEPLVDKKENDRTMRDITVDFLFGRRVR